MVWFSGAVRSIGVDPLTLEGGLIYQTVLGLLGATGINAHNMLFAIKQQIYAATEANMAAWQAGEASLNVISQGFTTPFVYGRLGKQRLFASVYPDFCQRAQPHHVGVGGCAIGDVQH